MALLTHPTYSFPLFQGSALKQYSGRTGERDNALIDQLKQGAIADLVGCVSVM